MAANTDAIISLRKEVLDILSKRAVNNVNELTKTLRERGFEFSDGLLVTVLSELESEDKIELETMRARESPTEFIRNLRMNGDLWVALASVGLLVGGLGLPNSIIISALRSIAAVLVILLFSGYAAQAAMFPRWSELTIWKRMLIGAGLSISLVGLNAIVLDATTQGITQQSVIILSGAETLLLAVVAFQRRYTVSKRIPELRTA